MKDHIRMVQHYSGALPVKKRKMLKENSSLILEIQKALDIVISGGAFIAAYFIKRNLPFESMGGLSTDPNYYIVLLLIIIAWHISFKWMGMYLSYRSRPFRDFIITIIKSCLMGMVMVSVAMYFLHIQGVSRLLMGIFLVLNIFLLTLTKFIVFKSLQKIRKQGFNIKNILIVGSQERAKELIKTIEQNKDSGYRILGCFETEKEKIGTLVLNDYKVVGLIDDLESYLRNNIVDELIFAMPLKLIQSGNKYIDLAELMGITVRIVPDLELQYLMIRPGIAAQKFDDFFGVFSISMKSTPGNEGKLLVKDLFDFFGSLILLILFLPVFTGIGIALKLFSRGPVLYRQKRLGLNGRTFMVYKFRTMVDRADEMQKELAEMNEADGPVFKIRNDPRIIPWVGTFLRKTSLDELPQLFNVIKREMSLVGPRPPIPKEVNDYVVWQRRRLSMKPGMTCLWQISPKRNEMSFEEWMKLDLKYIDNWSLFTDFKILFLTVRAVFTGAGR